MIQQVYTPVIKHKGFMPNPVAGNIPIWADSQTNPKAIDTKPYREFWDEQFFRCINGYDTAGIHIPGRYYFYLNFVVLQGLRGPMYPLYVDLDLEYYNLVEYVKKNKKTGIISVKARRKGLSEKSQTILSHGLRFIEGYRGAVCAGLDTYQAGLRNKFDNAQARFHQELRLNTLFANEKEYHIGYERKDSVGGFVQDGYGGWLSFATMYDDFSKLEGEYFNDVIMEEAGQFKLLGKTFNSIRPALEFGMFILGTFYIFGRGGNILSTSKDFKEMWDHADTYGLEKFWVPGSRFYFPFFGNNVAEKFIDEETNELIEALPNLKHFKPYQRIGCEDIEAADKYITKKKLEYAKLPDKKKLKEYSQNYPQTIEEAFTSGGSNNFNDDRIYGRLFDLEGGTDNYRSVILDWVYEIGDDGIKRQKQPLQVEYRPAKKGDPYGEICYMYQGPRTDMLDLDIGGIDGYNQDETQTSKSLGAMVVLRQGHKVNLVNEGIHDAIYPVFLYYKRPARKEIFYETCLKISVLYNLVRNTMANAEQDFVIDYYMKNNGRRYLSQRPRAFDAPRSQQVHKFGAKMTGYSKPMILGLAQSYVEDYINYCYFIEILRDMLAYDEEYVGTDWDSVDALAYAIMRIEDMRTRPRKGLYEEDQEGELEWKFDEYGNAILISEYVPKETVKKSKVNLAEGPGGWSNGDELQSEKENKREFKAYQEGEEI